MKIEIKKRYQNQEIIEELDSLIDEGLSLFEDFATCRVSGANIKKLERIETILLDHFKEKSNFDAIFRELKISYGNLREGFHSIFYNLLGKLGNSNKTKDILGFLEILNEKVNELKSQNIKNYNYYIPTRLELKLEKNELIKLKRNLKKAFNIQFVKIPQYLNKQIKSQPLASFFKNRQTLKITSEGRDYIFPSQYETYKLILGFLGTLAFCNHYGRDKQKWMSRSDDFSLATNPLEDYILIENNKKIVYPSGQLWQILDAEIKDEDIRLIFKEIWNIHNKPRGNFPMLLSILKLISTQEKKLRLFTSEILELYLDAISEKKLELSFLKFWIIIEKIIKCSRKITDENLKKTLTKIIKNKHIGFLIEGLHKKRNKIVHEFKTDFISQPDRNLTKALAESVILFLIDPPVKINNLGDIPVILDIVTLSKFELKNKKRILDKINRIVK